MQLQIKHWVNITIHFNKSHFGQGDPMRKIL